MYKHKHDKGSFTVEVSMIFTLIVFVILTLLFTFLYMQQKASLVSAASFAAQQGAELWQDSRKSMENGEVNKAEADSIGYRVFDNLLFSSKTFEGYFQEVSAPEGRKKLVLKMDAGDSLPGQKVSLIGEALCKRIGSTVLRPKSSKVRITYINNALRGRLSVEIIQEIKVPLGGIKALFDGKDTLTLNGQSKSAVTEPAEYIRNIDLAIELSKKLEGELDLLGLIDKIKSNGQK
ncbi:MAG: TadE family protein [Clostridia bacterium]